MKVDLFPSTRTDYILMNQTKKPYNDVHVRRAISYAIDRQALVKNMLFGNGTVANSFICRPRPTTTRTPPACSTTWPRPRRRWRVERAERLHHHLARQSGDAVDAAIAQILQASLKELGSR